MVHANTSFLKENAGSKGISFDINIEDDQSVFADQNMTNCIIRNLLSNAIKFSYPNSFIKISAYQENIFCIVEVQDKGVGMGEKTLSKLLRMNILNIRQVIFLVL
jgi:signal transduction histidine kinase